MVITLKNTNSSAIASAIRKARRNLGTATGQVFTLLVVCKAHRYGAAVEAARDAARAHPSRVLIVVQGTGKATRLDAEIETGETIPGDLISLRVSGDLLAHADTVVLPLLLPDSPVVAWWPYESPDQPGEDVIGRLADRRITDASGAAKPLQAMRQRARNHTSGDTDLTWTRLTPWRALLAAALDQYATRIQSASVEADRDNAPAELMAAWLQSRLGVPVTRSGSHGPGLTAIRLQTPAGDIAVVRTDGLMASYEVPGQPRRLVALKRRNLTQLLTEELGRLDSDDIFDEAARVLLQREEQHANEAAQAAAEKAARAATRKRKVRPRKTPRTAPAERRVKAVPDPAEERA